jgi:hypothetical protein
VETRFGAANTTVLATVYVKGTCGCNRAFCCNPQPQLPHTKHTQPPLSPRSLSHLEPCCPELLCLLHPVQVQQDQLAGRNKAPHRRGGDTVCVAQDLQGNRHGHNPHLELHGHGAGIGEHGNSSAGANSTKWQRVCPETIVNAFPGPTFS